MSASPCLVRFFSESGQVRYRLGDRLVDRYLEFVAGRCRPNALRALAFDLKTFLAVTGKDPVEVTAADVSDFLADQRGGDRTVVRLADRESGLSARTIARRLSSVSGPYAYLVARGDTPVRVNPVPRGLLTRRQGGSKRSRTAPLVRGAADAAADSARPSSPPPSSQTSSGCTSSAPDPPGRHPQDADEEVLPRRRPVTGRRRGLRYRAGRGRRFPR